MPSIVLKLARLAAVFALLPSLLFLMTGCSKGSRISRHLAKGDAYYGAGDLDRARLEYLSVLQLDPGNVHAMGQLGHVFFENGVGLQAGAAFEQAIKLGSTEPRILARLGTLLAAGGKIDQARQDARKAIEADPTQEDALFLLADLANDEASATEFKALLGRLRTQKGPLPIYDAAEAEVELKRHNVNGALALAGKAVNAAPSSASAQLVLAGVYFAQTNLVAGEAALARSAELSPPRSTRQIQYFNFLWQRGSTNEARALLEKIIKAAPDFVPAHLRKAQVAFAEHQYELTASEIGAVLAHDPVSVDARLLQSQLHLTKHEPEKAAQIMEQLVKQFPNSPQLQYQAAVASLASQNTSQALRQLDRAYELDPVMPGTVLLRGRLYLARGQVVEVIKSVQRLIATNANIRAAYPLLGEALRANGELDRALALFRSYEQRFTNDPAGPQSVGMLLLAKQDMAGARRSFENACSIKPDFFPALERLVRLDLSEHKIPAAMARAQRLVDQQPKLAEGRLLLAEAQLAATNAPAAEQDLEKAIELNPQLQPAYLVLAQIYSESNRTADAVAKLKSLLEKRPADQKALMMLGVLYTKLGNVNEAAECYEKLLKINDAFSPALNNLAYLYSEKLDRLPRAYELARKSRDLLPNDPRIADTLGWILYRRKDYAQALVYLVESATGLAQEGQSPQLGEVEYHLGMAHYALAHEGPARAAFQLALNLDPKAAWRKDVDERLAVLDADVTRNDPDTLKRLEQLERERRDDVLLLSRLAQAQEAAHQWDAALATYERAAAASPEAALPLIGQARVKAARGDAAGALKIARKARDLVRADASALGELGRVVYAAHDYSWSYALLQDAISDVAADPRAQFALAQSAIAVGRLDSALNALAKVPGNPRAALQLKLIPYCTTGSPQPLPRDVQQQLAGVPAGELLADYLKARSRASGSGEGEAVQELDQLLKAYPQFIPAKRTLAWLLVDRPDAVKRAETLAREVREVQPGDPEMARVLGKVAFDRSDFRYAADMLKEAARALKQDGQLLLLLGRAQAEIKQVADARQTINQALNLPLTATEKQQAQQLLQQLK